WDDWKSTRSSSFLCRSFGVSRHAVGDSAKHIENILMEDTLTQNMLDSYDDEAVNVFVCV
ncbi:MAG: hypothetical protein JSV60_07750, partial [Desulfobacterales bacterium]